MVCLIAGHTNFNLLAWHQKLTESDCLDSILLAPRVLKHMQNLNGVEIA